MIPLSHLSFVQCEQVKFRSKKIIKIKGSHSVVTVGRGAKAVKRDVNFCNSFNLISCTISYKTLLYLIT